MSSSVYIIALALLCHSFCLASWTFKSKHGDVPVYISENSTRLAIDYSEIKLKRKKVTRDLLRQIKDKKIEMLKMIGVSKWNIGRTDVSEQEGITTVELTGSYIDSSKSKVYFVEYHHYGDSKRLQLLLTNGKKKDLERDARSSNLRKFRREYDI